MPARAARTPRSASPTAHGRGGGIRGSCGKFQNGGSAAPFKQGSIAADYGPVVTDASHAHRKKSAAGPPASRMATPCARKVAPASARFLGGLGAGDTGAIAIAEHRLRPRNAGATQARGHRSRRHAASDHTPGWRASAPPRGAAADDELQPAPHGGRPENPFSKPLKRVDIRPVVVPR
jgi:hypothetical protein